MNLLGKPVDEAGAIKAVKYMPIHRPAPDIDQQDTSTAISGHGIKVVDLLAPYRKGGKIGLFGGGRRLGKPLLSRSLIHNIAKEHGGYSVFCRCGRAHP